MTARGNLLQPVDVAIVGGGLAGLTAAVRLARSGLSVALFERSSKLGGRARTRTEGGARFNLGPHALYAQGAASPTLRDLGVPIAGHRPTPKRPKLVYEGRAYDLPSTPLALLGARVLAIRDRLEVARFFARLPKIVSEPLAATTLGDWLADEIRGERARQFVQALVRVATYTDDPGRLSAGAAIAQLQAAFGGGVLYLDGGWQTLVDGLRVRALEHGARIETGARVVAVEGGDHVRELRLADGRTQRATSAVLAVDPSQASAMVESGQNPVLSEWAESAVAVRAACLDVALEGGSRPRVEFALGLDRPYYYSAHSVWARLAPEGTSVIHVAKYLRADEAADARRDERELIDMLELLEPGWETRCVARRFLPGMTVTNALVTARAGGLAGRPGPAVPGIRRLFVAGDWVGGEGMLADAAVASANRATDAILRDLRMDLERAS